MQKEAFTKGRDDAGDYSNSRDDAGGHYKKVEMLQKEGIIKGRDDAGGCYKKEG